VEEIRHCVEEGRGGGHASYTRGEVGGAVQCVFSVVPGENFIGRILTKSVEEFDCLAVVEDIEEEQEFPMDEALVALCKRRSGSS
jgi:hypothetical protein